MPDEGGVDPAFRPGFGERKAPQGFSRSGVEGENCGGGIKIQDETLSCTFEFLRFEGGANGTANSGIKVQGRPDYIASDITIKKIVSANATSGSGLFTYACRNVTIGSYTGVNCGKLGAIPDCDLRGTSVSIGSISSTQAGHSAIVVSDDKITRTDINIEKIDVRNPNGRAVQVSAASGFVRIGELRANDDQAQPTMSRILSISSQIDGRCGYLETNLAIDPVAPRLFVAAGNYKFTIEKAVLSGDPLDATVVLRDGHPSTFVHNSNVFQVYAGAVSDQLRPDIQLTTENGDSVPANFRIAVVPSSAGTGFTIFHENAVSGMKVRYHVGAWRVFHR